MLTQARLKELFHYDPATGVFTRLVRTSSNARVGDVAGYLSSRDGYRSIWIGERDYQEHRLAWLYMTGAWPVAQIDHIDGYRANNKFANLRDVPHNVNMQNQKRANVRNKLGVLGVSPCGKKFRAYIEVDGKCFYLGVFPSPDVAHACYLEAKRRLHAGNTL